MWRRQEIQRLFEERSTLGHEEVNYTIGHVQTEIRTHTATSTRLLQIYIFTILSGLWDPWARPIGGALQVELVLQPLFAQTPLNLLPLADFTDRMRSNFIVMQKQPWHLRRPFNHCFEQVAWHEWLKTTLSNDKMKLSHIVVVCEL